MKTNLRTGIALVLLTTVSFLASETFHGHGAAVVVLAMAAVKCAALGWQFMELRAAHWFWRAGMLATVAGLLGVVGALVVRA